MKTEIRQKINVFRLFCPMAPYFLTSTFVGNLDEEIGLKYIPRYDLFQLVAATKTFNLFAKPSFAASVEI